MLSVIIPTYNRWPSLQRTLDSLLCQTFPSDQFEIIVVDDGSTDETSQWVEKIARVRYARQAHHGPAAARNRGASIAIGEILIFIDDDCTAPVDWLERLRRYFTQPNHVMVGGKTVNAVPNRYWSHIHQIIIDFWQDTINHGHGADLFLTSNNMAIRKTVFFQVHGFDEKFARAGAEDRNLTRSIFEAGWQVDFSGQIVIRHHHELTLKNFSRQHFHYGQGSFLLYDQPDRSSSHPPWPLLFRLLRYSYSGSSFLGGIKRLSAVMFSQLCVVCGFLTQACKKRNQVCIAGVSHRPTSPSALFHDLLPLFISATILVGFGSINWALVSRMLSHEHLGLLTGLLSLHLILWPIMDVCTSGSMVRLAGSHADTPGEAKARLIFRTGLLTQLFIAFLICTLILALPGTWTTLVFKGQISVPLLWILAGGLLGLTCYEFIYRMASARLKFRTMALMQGILSAVRLVVLLIYFLLPGRPDIATIFFIYMASYWIPLFFSWPALRPLFKCAAIPERTHTLFWSWEVSKKLLHYGSWVSLANILLSINQYLGALLLLRYGLEREAGIFGLALMASTFIIVLINTIQHYFLPFACRLQDRDRIGRFYRSSLKVTIPIFVLTGCLVGAGYYIFPIWFGEKGSGVYPIFVLLCLSHLIGSLFKPLYNIFHFLYKPYLISIDLFCRLALLLPLASWLIPQWGAKGMATAQLIAIITSSILTFGLYRLQLRPQSGADS